MHNERCVKIKYLLSAINPYRNPNISYQTKYLLPTSNPYRNPNTYYQI